MGIGAAFRHSVPVGGADWPLKLRKDGPRQSDAYTQVLDRGLSRHITRQDINSERPGNSTTEVSHEGSPLQVP